MYVCICKCVHCVYIYIYICVYTYSMSYIYMITKHINHWFIISPQSQFWGQNSIVFTLITMGKFSFSRLQLTHNWSILQYPIFLIQKYFNHCKINTDQIHYWWNPKMIHLHHKYCRFYPFIYVVLIIILLFHFFYKYIFFKILECRTLYGPWQTILMLCFRKV